ncbi:MAG: UdgX family uracil-DNA binding protein [Steroidobacteraceae bacterium]|nr:UdgX family uracil-DNA binding protein [Steroidobacteraceae bacterium]
MQQVRFEPTFEGWRNAARESLARGLPPEALSWVELTSPQSALDLTSANESHKAAATSSQFRIPRTYIEIAKTVALHSSPRRWALLYHVLWRLTHGESKLLEVPVDPDVIELMQLESAVKKDAYRMRAFVRFRGTRLGEEPWFVAWYEPEHDTLALNQKFFAERFANMRWSILTPARCMHWDGTVITFSPGARKVHAPAGDGVEQLWVEYYSHIFNPARIKPAAMQAQLLKRNWKNLPEAAVIEPLLREAPRRTAAMIARSEFLRVRETDYGLAQPPVGADLQELRSAAAGCRACPLWKTATCTVFGEGPRDAHIVLVGEQPGDGEDRAGKPFVGPAGQVLNDALAQAGIDRRVLYVTNAVKHFKFEPRGKRRMHMTPAQQEIAACRPWLEAELRLLEPSLIVALGATAARSILQTPVRVTQERGRVLKSEFGSTLVTLHPSALLRLPPDKDFRAELDAFVADLRKVRAAA